MSVPQFASHRTSRKLASPATPRRTFTQNRTYRSKAPQACVQHTLPRCHRLGADAPPEHPQGVPPTSFTQYELSTRRPPSLRPARSSATLRRLRVGFSCVMPWFTGLPYTMPCAPYSRQSQYTRPRSPAAGAAPALRSPGATPSSVPAGVAAHLVHWLLAAAAAYAYAIDYVALLGLVAHAARLVRARRASEPHDPGQLAVLPAAHAQQEPQHVALLPLVQLLHILRRANSSQQRPQASAGV